MKKKILCCVIGIICFSLSHVMVSQSQECDRRGGRREVGHSGSSSITYRCIDVSLGEGAAGMSPPLPPPPMYVHDCILNGG